jgi:hypothetical protein
MEQKVYLRKTSDGLPNRATIPKSNKCEKSFNLCKPRCKDCFWFVRNGVYHPTAAKRAQFKSSKCTYPKDLWAGRNKNKIRANSPSCSFWNVLYFSRIRKKHGKVKVGLIKIKSKR